MKKGIEKYFFCGLTCLVFMMMSMQAMGQNSLAVYTGKYQMNVNGYHAQLEVYIKDNKLRAKQSWDGRVRTFEYLSDNKFIIAMDGWAIKFIRNKQNKVIQMEVLANEVWVKV